MISSYCDRSTAVEMQECPRRRYFNSEIPMIGEKSYNGEMVATVNGIRPVRVNMDLLLGSTFHQGIQYILEDVRDDAE